MRRFKSSLSMCFPHKYWVKEWQVYHNKTHDDVKCKEKYKIHRITPPVCYVYDNQTQHRCLVCKTSRPDALAVNNLNAYHICVDGGLIRLGCRIYMLDPIYKIDTNYPKGRCDSIVFDRQDLWFIEFKMNTTTTLDTQRWKNLKEGMKQLMGFVLNLRCKMGLKRTPLHRYYSLKHQHCVICMKAYPLMNVSRNNYLERFRQETGIKLLLSVAIP